MSANQTGVSGKSINNFDEESKRLEQEQMAAETVAFSEQINNLLKKDDDCKRLKIIPILNAETLYEVSRDGILLSKLASVIEPGCINMKDIKLTVDKSKLNTPGAKDAWEIAQNNNAMLAAAKKLGCKVVGIGAEDIVGKNDHLILAVVWQMIRAHLMKSVNLLSHPELIRLLQGDEKIDKLLTMRSEDIIKRWFNYHLRRAGPGPNGEIRVVNNFGKDIQSCENWCVLFQQIAPKEAEEAGINEVMAIKDNKDRAEALLVCADKMDCRQFTTANDIVACRERLNLAFTATIFNAHIGIKLPTEAEIVRLMTELDELRAKVVDCLDQKKELENIINNVFNEQAAVLGEIAQLEHNLGRNNDAGKRKDELVKIFQANGKDMQDYLAVKSEVDKAQLDKKLIEVDDAIASFELYKKKMGDQVQVNKDKIAELEGRISDQEQANKDLEDLVNGKGNSVEEMQAKLDAKLKECEGKHDLIEGYIKEFVDLYTQQDTKKQTPTINGNEDREKLNGVIEANNILIKRFTSVLDERNQEFKRHKDEEQRQVDELNSQVSSFLGDGQSNVEDGISNMKRLLELMIEKCRKQNLHIQTQQITIEKKDAINAVMGAKIRDIADDQLSKQKKKSFFGGGGKKKE